MTALSPDLVLRDHTRIGSAPLTPELRFHLADPQSDLWRQEEEALIAQGLPSPFWAFAWGGGQALARLVLDQPERVKDKRVLDFACGCGVVADRMPNLPAEHIVPMQSVCPSWSWYRPLSHSMHADCPS